MRLINTPSKDDGLSSDPNTDGEIDDAKASSFCTVSTDIDHDLQYEEATAVATPHSFAYHKHYQQQQQQQQIRQQLRQKSDGQQQEEDVIAPDPAIRSTRQRCVRCFFGILYLITMIGSLLLGVNIMCGTLEIGLNPQAASIGGVVLIVIAALLLCLPFAVLIRRCYRKDPTQTIRGFSIVLGMWTAAIAGSFVGIYPYIAILGLSQPWAIVFGGSSSLLTCLLLACRLKTLRIQNMLHRFYRTQLAVAILVPNPIPFGILLFFAEEQQETVRTAELDLFIGTIFWQFLFLTTSTMTWFNLVGLGLGLFLACLATIVVWPFLLHYIYKKSASFVDWLVVTHGQQHLLMVRMLVPNFEIINDTKDVISSKQNKIVDTHLSQIV